MAANLPAWLTLKDAARCVNLSKRTLKRRIEEGALSGELRRQGAQDVWMVQTAELQRWAGEAGQALQVPQDVRQATTEGGAGDRTEGAQDAAASASVDKLRQDLAATEARLAEVKERMKDLQAERDWLRDQVDKILPMLPAAQEKADEARQRAAEEARQRAAAEARADKEQQERAAIAAEADNLRRELEAKKRRTWWEKLMKPDG